MVGATEEQATSLAALPLIVQTAFVNAMSNRYIFGMSLMVQ
jgi:hypothetical protein